MPGPWDDYASPDTQTQIVGPPNPLKQNELQRGQTSLARDSATLPFDVNKAQADAANATRQNADKRRDDIRTLADDYQKRPGVQNYSQAISVYSSGLRSAPSSVGDLQLINSYAKILDPNSVVREGEAAAVANAQPFIERVKALTQKLQSEGGQFTPDTRRAIRNEMRTRMEELNRGYIADRVFFKDAAKMRGYDPIEIIGRHLGIPFQGIEAQATGRPVPKLDYLGNPIPDQQFDPRVGKGVSVDNLVDMAVGDDKPVFNQDGSVSIGDRSFPSRALYERDQKERSLAAAFGTKPEDPALLDNDAYRNAYRGIFGENPSGFGHVTYTDPAAKAQEEQLKTDRTSAAGGVDAFVRGLADVPTFGGSDELGAGLDTIFNGGTMRENLRSQRAVTAMDEEVNPYLRMGGQLLGSLALPTRVPGATAAGGIGAGARQAALEGGLYAGGYGFGSADGDITDRLKGGIKGGLGGAGAGYLLGQALPRATDRLAGMFGRRGPAPGNLDVARASQAEAVPVGRPVIDPAQRDRMMLLEGSIGGHQTVRNSLDRSRERIGERLAEIGGGGAVRDAESLGQTAQDAGRRWLNRTGDLAGRQYRRAEALSGNRPFQAREAVADLDAQIAELSRNPNANGALVDYLRGVRSDFVDDAGNFIPKTIGDVRSIRSGMRGDINRRGLTMSDADRRLTQALGAANRDIQRELSGSPEALTAYRRADAIWAARKTEERQILDRLNGRADNPISGTQTTAKLREMIAKDPDRLRRFMRMTSPNERADFSATIAEGMGRARPGEPFQLGAFLNNTKSLSPAGLRATFGQGGAQSIENLRVLSRALVDTQGRLNNTRSGVITAKNLFNNVIAPMIPGVAGGAYAGSGTMAAGGAALAAVRPGYQFLSARSLMNPDLTRWLRTTATSPSVEFMRRQINRLPAVASRNPSIAAEVSSLQQGILKALNDNTIGRSARSAAEGENEQKGAQ